jgi:hypothetical protein
VCRPCAGQTWGPLVVSFGTTLCLFWHFMVSFDTLYCVQALLDTHMGALRCQKRPTKWQKRPTILCAGLTRHTHGGPSLCAHKWPAFPGILSFFFFRKRPIVALRPWMACFLGYVFRCFHNRSLFVCCFCTMSFLTPSGLFWHRAVRRKASNIHCR